MSDHSGGATEPLKSFLSTVLRRLEVPACEIVVHLFVTALAVVSIALIEVLLHAVRLDAKNILWTNITLGEWMFCLEVMAVTAVLGVGIIKAVLAIGKAS